MKKNEVHKEVTVASSGSYKSKKARWNDWKWQIKNRITTLEEISKYSCFINFNCFSLGIKSVLLYTVTMGICSALSSFKTLSVV